MRGKALEAGTEGDTINVLNLQSKRTVSGLVIGRDQVAISIATPRLPARDATSTIGATETAAPVSVAATSNAQTSPKPE
jgi:flagella basal body P-ring formation protein FlgA